MALFNSGGFTIHHGRSSSWTINCAEFTEDDWTCVAELIAERYPNFEMVVGVSHFGKILAEHLEQYITHGGILLVDDILWLPTMQSTRLYWRTRKRYVQYDIQGFVIFSCIPCPNWVRSLWQLDVRTETWREYLGAQ